MDKKTQGSGAAPAPPETPDAPATPGRSKGIIALLVVAIFLGLVVVKLALDNSTSTGEDAPATTSITSVHNDAIADYEAALASGKPIYVLFHSMTCEPCAEISEVADEVLPDYEGEVVFVNVITDDPSGQQLAAKFSFQYIPTSFFLAPGGESVVDSFTGAMGAAEMRAYLDALREAE